MNTLLKTVDEWEIKTRVVEIRREVAEILTANGLYQGQFRHNQLQIGLHETRRVRLHEILTELDALRRSLQPNQS